MEKNWGKHHVFGKINRFLQNFCNQTLDIQMYKEMSKVKGNQRKKQFIFLCTGVHQYQKCPSLFNITNYSAKVYQPV